MKCGLNRGSVEVLQKWHLAVTWQICRNCLFLQKIGAGDDSTAKDSVEREVDWN